MTKWYSIHQKLPFVNIGEADVTSDRILMRAYSGRYWIGRFYNDGVCRVFQTLDGDLLTDIYAWTYLPECDVEVE